MKPIKFTPIPSLIGIAVAFPICLLFCDLKTLLVGNGFLATWIAVFWAANRLFPEHFEEMQ